MCAREASSPSPPPACKFSAVAISSRSRAPGAQLPAGMASDEDKWKKVLDQSSVPACLKEPLLTKGYKTASIFSHAFPDNEVLERFLESFLLSADAAPLGLTSADWSFSPAAGTLRRLWYDAEADPSARPARATPASASGDWMEQLPPRLKADEVEKLKDAFLATYPSEILDDTCMPGQRLLSTIHAMFQPGGEPRWLPWKHLVSRSQELDISESKAMKVPRADLLHVLQAASTTTR